MTESSGLFTSSHSSPFFLVLWELREVEKVSQLVVCSQEWLYELILDSSSFPFLFLFFFFLLLHIFFSIL